MCWTKVLRVIAHFIVLCSCFGNIVISNLFLKLIPSDKRRKFKVWGISKLDFAKVCVVFLT